MGKVIGFTPIIFCLGIATLCIRMITVSGVHSAATQSTITKKYIKKTVKSDDEDLIDCIHMYKQPAFAHPLLQNHTIKRKPSWHPQGVAKTTSALREQPRRVLFNNRECPEGTIPILRTQTTDEHIVHPSDSSNGDITHEFALLRTDYDGHFRGATGAINVWNPHVEPNEFSSSKLMLKRGSESIHVGFMVNPILFGDDRTRLFSYWKGANGGCYNLLCPGFVQVSTQYLMGGHALNISQVDGPQYGSMIHVFKDSNTSNWWFSFQGDNIGYWPSDLFDSMRNFADTIEWGGEIINANPAGPHTTTQMGSGHFPDEGYRRASVLSNIQVVDEQYRMMDPRFYNYLVNKRYCYHLIDYHDQGTVWAYYFFFGGPGFNANCRT